MQLCTASAAQSWPWPRQRRHTWDPELVPRLSGGGPKQAVGLVHSLEFAGGKSYPHVWKIISPHTSGVCLHQRPHSLPARSSSSSSTSSFSLPHLLQTLGSKQKAHWRRFHKNGRSHSYHINSIVLCDSENHQYLPQRCCHVGPLALNTDRHSAERLSCSVVCTVWLRYDSQMRQH